MVTPESPASPLDLLEQIQKAQNAQDLEGFLDCFAEDYHSEQPIHPDRTFTGSTQVRKNWSAVFKGVPDFHAELLRTCLAGDTVWAEWEWKGTPVEGGSLWMRGVTLFGVRDGRLAWGRLYMEPVQEPQGGIEENVRKMTSGFNSSK